MTRFRVVAADPPWQFGDALGRRGAEHHYPCMPVDEICRFGLPMSMGVADDAVLFLWRVAAMQQEALDVARAWGFVVKSEIVWQKTTLRGKRHFGMGRYVRQEHETCLIATRGRPRIKARNIRSTFAAPRGRHSEKPEFFYREIVERLCDGPFVELFARRPRDGWTVLGNEV